MTSTVKVNTLTVATGCTMTLGESGKTVALASGASQTGFGRTGTVDWQTTPKTGDFTAANGEGYFVNTTSGAVVMTMPSGSAGAIVSIQDYNKTFDSNALTVTPASGEKINGGTADGTLVISTEGQGLTFVYVDATVGWKTVHENEFTSGGSSFITATGGTITTSGNCKIHTFTGPGTFTVCTVSPSAPNNVVSYLVVAGGGAGGGADQGTNGGAGGGGAGGFREYKSPVTPYTASPLNGNPGGTAVTVTATAFPITVGSGGPGTDANKGGNGNNSIFSTIISTGGGGGGARTPAPATVGCGADGGSGGGGSYGNDPGTNNGPGSGNTPPVSPPQGKDGGDYGGASNPGGGGGATVAGSTGSSPGGGGAGGAGATTSITGSPVAYAGGGGGASRPSPSPGPGGTGGGGAGVGNNDGTAGTPNTGGGGGAGSGCASPSNSAGGNGGSGIVIIRYKFQ